MKNLWSVYLKGILALLFFYNSIVLGSEPSVETGQLNPTLKTQASLTPRQKGKTKKTTKETLLLSQQPQPSSDVVTGEITRSPLPSPPLPTPPLPLVATATPLPATESAISTPTLPTLESAIPVTSATDPFVYSELDRLAADINKLKNDTKKPDTKKTWSVPKITGCFFLDNYFVDEDAKTINRLQNKSGVRAMEIYASGNGFQSFDYRVELSFEPDTNHVSLVDNWVGIQNVPLLGYVRAGYFKPETGLAYLASTSHTSLSEFDGPSETFGLRRHAGVSSEHLFAKDRVRLFYGLFQGDPTDKNSFVEDDNPGTIFNVRLTTVPIYENEGRQVFHIGGHWSYVHSRNDQTAMSIQPGANNWYTALLKTGTFANNNHHRAGLELALQNGAVSMSSEWYVARYADHETQELGYSPDRTATGGYIELGYFLTNDYRSYQLKRGTFGTTKMKHNFHPFKSGEWNLIDGFGAWQLILQWSYLDLLDWRNAQGSGGRQNDLIFGVNWFWTPNIRWIFEYVHSQQNTGSNYQHRSEDIFGTCLRLHF